MARSDKWEYPERKRRGLRKRVAISLVYSALFFAGAALTAGAGNEFVKVDASGDGPVAAATDTSTTDTTATDATTTDETTDTTTTDAAAAVTVTVTTTTETTDESTTAAAPDSAPPDATPVPDSSGDAITVPAPPVQPAPGPQPTPVVAPLPKPSLPLPSKHPTNRHVRTLPRPVRVATPFAAAAPSPFPVLPFDLTAWMSANPGSPMGQAAVAIAEHFVGVPYRWGGNQPSTGLDCSGLTQYVYAQLGVWLPHYAAAQFLAYPRLDPSQLEPGDLVFFEPKADGPGHVAIYAGGDEIVEAPHTGAFVRVSSFSDAAASMGFLGAVRPYADGTLPPTQRLFGLGTVAVHTQAWTVSTWGPRKPV